MNLKKLAAGPPVIKGFESKNIIGAYIPPKDLSFLENKNRQLFKSLDKDKSWRKKGLILLSNQVPKKHERTFLRHELVHYLNLTKKKKYQSAGKPTLRGVLDSYKNEIAAYKSEIPKHQPPKSKTKELKRILAGSHNSVKQLYKGNKNILKSLIRLKI